MKRIISILMLISITTLLCSCKTKISTNEPDYSAFAKKQSIDSTISGDADTKNNTVEAPNITNTPNNTSKPISQGHDPEKEWPFEMDFTAIASSKEIKLGNINVNRKTQYSYSHLVCYDADNDTSYYINFGNDNYIYELKDDSSTLLIDMEAICLQLWNNELYFLANNYKNKELLTGDIYCYNLANKELRLVLEADANFLYIDSYGIYFSQYELPQPDFLDTLQFTGYLLDFGTNTVQEVDYILPVAYNEYLLYVCNEGIVLHNRETNEKLLIAPEVYYYLNNFNFYDHYLIFTYNSKICILDLLSGEKKIYDFKDDKSLRYEPYLMDYIILDDIFYGTITSPVIFTCNLSTGELDVYYYLIYDVKSYPSIPALFTDGKRIYAIMQEYGDDRLVEVYFTEQKSISGRKIFEIKEMGK